jgi:antitoxin ChpS
MAEGWGWIKSSGKPVANRRHACVPHERGTNVRHDGGSNDDKIEDPSARQCSCDDLPAGLLKALGTDVGAELALSVIDGKLVAQLVKTPGRRYSLSELLEGSELLAELNATTAWARTGKPLGGEMA